MSASSSRLSKSGRHQSPQVKNSVVYNIPAGLVDRYYGRKLILRSSSVAEIVSSLSRAEPESIRFIQLLSTDEDASVLEGFAESVPVEIVLKNPADQYQRLYNYKSLLDSHPIRISIPVIPRFSYAAKLAISLNYAVKLELNQPDEELVKEVESILDLYLHRSFVAHPVEFFHTMLQSFYSKQPVSLWEIAEEDPEIVRYVTDDGEETISRRFVGVKLDKSLHDFVSQFGQELIDERRECHDCEYFTRCGGYFKWPDRTFKCEGVKRVFRTLATTAEEVRRDLERFDTMGAQSQS